MYQEFQDFISEDWKRIKKLLKWRRKHNESRVFANAATYLVRFVRREASTIREIDITSNRSTTPSVRRLTNRGWLAIPGWPESLFPFFSCNGELRDVIVRRHFRSACQKAYGSTDGLRRARMSYEKCPRSEKKFVYMCIYT